MKIVRFFLLGLISLFIISCALSPVKTQPSARYTLDTIPQTLQVKARKGTLLILPTEISPAYNTTQMAYTTQPYQIAYFAKHVWAETPAQMLQPLIIQTLQNTHVYRAIVTTPYTGLYDYSLNTQILEIKQDYSHAPAMLRMKLRAQLSRASGQVIATKQFIANEPIRPLNPYGGVYAANRAIAQILRELVVFAVKH